MELDYDDIEAFKTLFEQEFDELIEWSEAERMAGELVALYETIWKAKVEEIATPPRDAATHIDQSAI